MQAEEQGIILRLDAPNDLPSVSVDTTCMTQVLNNLVSNALRFTEEGEIVLEATANEETVQLQVRDTGAGIAPEDLPHVFNLYMLGQIAPTQQKQQQSQAKSLIWLRAGDSQSHRQSA